jgi:hypothetical protein
VLVSNDQMRDHIFELLRPKYFLKWRAHHHFTYRVASGHVQPVHAPPGAQGLRVGPTALDIVPPPRFTTCVQQLPESGAWMVPLAGNRWLCARPRGDARVDGEDVAKWGCAQREDQETYRWRLR